MMTNPLKTAVLSIPLCIAALNSPAPLSAATIPPSFPSTHTQPPSREKIAKLANSLGAAKFADREAATRKLIELGFYARPFVKEALNSKDPEVRGRAQKIWESIRWTVFPGAKPDLGKFVSRLESGDLNASDNEWRKFIYEYGAEILPLLLRMSENPKTASSARSGLAFLLKTASPLEIAEKIAGSKNSAAYKKMLTVIKPEKLSTETRKDFFSILEKLGMDFETVDMAAALWRPNLKFTPPATAEKLLKDENTAKKIYDQALESFNNSHPTLEKDWKLCFYLSDAAKRGRSKLISRFIENLDYHPTRKRVTRFIAKKLLQLSLPEQALEQLSGQWSSTATYLKMLAAKKKNEKERSAKLEKLLLDSIDSDNAKMLAVANLAAKFKDPFSTELYEKILKSPKCDIHKINALLRLSADSERARDYKNAINFYKKALSVSGKFEKVKLKNGERLINYLKHRLKNCEAILNGGVDTWKKASDALRKKKYDEALKLLNEFIARSPTFAPALSNKAIALEKLGRDKEAIAALNEALKITDPVADERFQIRCIYRQIDILQKTKRFKEIVELLEKAALKHPKNPAIFSSLGFNAYFAGQYGKSAEAFKFYRELKPDDIYSALWRFNALKLMRLDPKPAFAKFAEKLKTRKWPRPVVDLYNGKITAGECLAKAQSNKPKRENEKKCEAYFYIAESLYLDGKQKEARKFYKKCLACDIPEFLESMESEIRLKEIKGGKRK